MTNCKNCKMTDEYCASGDCSNDTLILRIVRSSRKRNRKMWKWQLKQNNLVVARGFSDNKETCLTEAFRYTEQYSEEDFNKMVLIIKEFNND